jgi:hypothetical protein
MIATTGRHMKVDGPGGYTFERTAESPGMVTLRLRSPRGGGVAELIELPAHASEMEALIAGYRRIVAEEVGYRTMENE